MESKNTECVFTKIKKIMYYIYHIPGVKIGCSIQPKIRVKAQGYSEYEILEEHNNKIIAGEREIQLQKKYGYSTDNCKYYETNYSSMGKKGGPRGGKKTRDSGKLLESAKLAWSKERSEKQLESVRKNISIAQKFAWSAPRSEKQLDSMRKAQKIGSALGATATYESTRKSIEVRNFSDDSFVGNYKSIKECAIALGISICNVSSVINGRQKKSKGYTFKQIEKI